MERSSGTDESNKTVGITLITGFLGAGKSSLIRRVLTEDHGLRIVVVENEFGATTAIEQAIVTQGVGKDTLEEFIELPNGCICCQAQDDLVDSLTRLVEQKRGRFDHILVEASGLADPRPVAASFWVDDFAEASLHLDSVVAVVDASRLGNDGDFVNHDLARKQIAIADIVLLNKLDLISTSTEQQRKEKETEFIQFLKQNGCVASIIPTVKCNIDIKDILNIHAYDSEASINNLSPHNNTPEKFKHHVHSEGDGKSENSLLSTFTLSFENVAFDSILLDRALGSLLWDQKDISNEIVAEEDNEHEKMQIWRMKALVVVKDEDEKWIYQSVHTLFDDMPSSVKAEDGKSQFLFIGQNMQKETIQNCLKQAMDSNSST